MRSAVRRRLGVALLVLLCAGSTALGPAPVSGAGSSTEGLRATTAASLGPVRIVRAPRVARTKRACRAGVVALTFDDGPRPGTTLRLVRELQRLGVPATFFEVGKNVAAHPGITRAVARAGFTIGNHSWNHPALSRLPDHRVRNQLRRTDAALRRAGVRPGPWMRPPYGAVTPRVRGIIHRRGLVTTLWNVDPDDWRGGNARQIAHQVLAQLRPHRYGGNVVLMHDGVVSSPHSVAAVPRIVQRARARGFCFGPLGPRGHASPPVPSAVVSTRHVPGAVDVRVRLTAPTSRTTALRVAARPGTARPGADYTAFTWVARFAPGSQTATLRVPTAGRSGSFLLHVDRPNGLVLTARSLDVHL